MKTIKKETKKTPLLILGLVLLIVSLLIVGYLVISKNTKQDTTVTESAGRSNNQTVTSEPTDSVSKEGSSEKPPVPETSSSQNEKANVQVIMTAQNQDSEADVYRLRYSISTVVSDGTCTLQLEKAGATISKQTPVFQAGASISTCQGFDIDLSELSAGEWKATMIFENSTLKGEASNVITVV